MRNRRLRCFGDETQGTLFFNIAEILAVKQPRALLLENVKNLATALNSGVNELEVEMANAGSRYGFVVVKRPRVNEQTIEGAAEQYAVVPLRRMVDIMIRLHEVDG